MKSNIYIYPYNSTSKSARLLGAELNALLIKKKGSKYRHSANKIVINWGAGSIPPTINHDNVINNPEAVMIASNKLLTLQKLKESNVPCPKFTQNIDEARQWLVEKDGRCVFARKLLRGKAGAGILACTISTELPRAPLYTRYIKKQDEYRVHIIGGKVVDVQRKMRKAGADVDWRIRTGSNGFIFGRGGVEAPAGVLEVSVRACLALGLDFGGVDTIWQHNSNKAFVLEVNTAPGLEGSTIKTYANQLRALINEKK